MPNNKEIIEQITNRDDAADAPTMDTDKLSLAEIRALAVAEAKDDQHDQHARDDKGRFASGPEADADADADGSDDAADDDADADDGAGETVYRREIDLGDGSGTEVFEAPTVLELLDKIVTAKANATKKIREQQAKLKELETKHASSADAEPDDEDFVIAQEILRKPTDAVKKAFKKATGLDITEFKTMADRIQAMDAAAQAQYDTQMQQEAAQKFVSSHPEYVANEQNGKRLSREMDSLIADAKRKGEEPDYGTLLTKAFDDLSESGLLVLKSADAANADKTTGTRTDRIDQGGATGQTQRRRSSSLSARAHSTSVPEKAALTEDDLYSMPLAKLKELANRAAR